MYLKIFLTVLTIPQNIYKRNVSLDALNARLSSLPRKVLFEHKLYFSSSRWKNKKSWYFNKSRLKLPLTAGAAFVHVFLSVHRSVCLTVRLIVCLSVHLHVYVVVNLSGCQLVCPITVSLWNCWSMFPSIFLCVYASVHLYMRVSVCLCVYASIHLCICLLGFLCIHLSMCRSIYLFVNASVCLIIFGLSPVHLSNCVTVHLSVHLSVFLSLKRSHFNFLPSFLFLNPKVSGIV